MNYHTRPPPRIPLYAEEIDKAYDEVRVDYPNAVAKRRDEYEISYFNGECELARLEKKDRITTLRWWPDKKVLEERF